MVRIVNPLPMITSAMILDGTIEDEDIENSAVITRIIDALAVTEAKIGLGAVTEDKIGALAVTVDKLADNAVESDKIKDGTIEGGDIKARTITDSRIAIGTILEALIGTGAVTVTKLATNAVETAKIKDANVTKVKLGPLPYVLWLQPFLVVGGETLQWFTDLNGRYSASPNTGQYNYGMCAIPLPVGAILQKVTFYGYLVNDASKLRFKVFRHTDITVNEGSSETLDDSALITGVTGIQSYVYDPSPDIEIEENKSYTLDIMLYADTTEYNARYHGCKIEFTI